MRRAPRPCRAWPLDLISRAPTARRRGDRRGAPRRILLTRSRRSTGTIGVLARVASSRNSCTLSPTPICLGPRTCRCRGRCERRGRRPDRGDRRERPLADRRRPARAFFLRTRRPRRDLQAGRGRKPRDRFPRTTSTAAYRASSARSMATAKISYSLSSSIVRSARPAVAATKSVVSPSCRSLRISATQSARRP